MVTALLFRGHEVVAMRLADRGPHAVVDVAVDDGIGRAGDPVLDRTDGGVLRVTRLHADAVSGRHRVQEAGHGNCSCRGLPA